MVVWLIASPDKGKMINQQKLDCKQQFTKYYLPVLGDKPLTNNYPVIIVLHGDN